MEENETAIKDSIVDLIQISKSNEHILKYLDVVFYYRKDKKEEKNPIIITVKEYLVEMNISRSNNERIFYVKNLINLIRYDHQLIIKIWKKYEFIFYSHNEDSAKIYLYFLSLIYSYLLDIEISKGSSDNSMGNQKKIIESIEKKSNNSKRVNDININIDKLNVIIESIISKNKDAPIILKTFIKWFYKIIDNCEFILKIFARILITLDFNLLQNILKSFNKKEVVNERSLLEYYENIQDIYTSKIRFEWIELSNHNFSNQCIIKNGVNIVKILISNPNEHMAILKNINLWEIISFVILSGNIENLNFENFEYFCNQIFELLTLSINESVEYDAIFKILKRLILYEIKNELTLKSLDSFLKKLLSDSSFELKFVDLLKEINSDLFENDVYLANLYSKFERYKTRILNI